MLSLTVGRDEQAQLRSYVLLMSLARRLMISRADNVEPRAALLLPITAGGPAHQKNIKKNLSASLNISL